MRATSTLLADGRELVYYDDAPRPGRDVVDGRALQPVDAASEVRHDRRRDEWVVVATHRQERTHLPDDVACPLCPSTPARPTEIPAADYDVVVFENRFPSLGGDGGGRCEVVCFTSDHEGSFAGLGSTRARTVVDAWADRTAVLSARPDVAQVFVFENRGPAIGVTLTHPHGQIYGYPFVTARTAREVAVAEEHRRRTGGDLGDEVLAAELEDGSRVVRASPHWTAFVPVAARWPIEVHLFPNRRVADLVELTDGERDDFCDLYLDVLGRVDRLHGVEAPYVAAWHQAPVRGARDLVPLRLELTSPQRAPDKLKYAAGSESAMGVFINDVRPEEAAAALRALGPG